MNGLKSSKSEIVILKAEPESIGIDLRRTAVVVIDMTNAFIRKGGSEREIPLHRLRIGKACGPEDRGIG